jgi:protein gp37
MNDIRKTIGWADYSWNPFRGLCPVGCWYCYAARMYGRFGWEKGLTWNSSPLEKYGKVKQGARIFVCSTYEIFHPTIDGAMRDWVFKIIAEHPEQTFIILTKLPARIDRLMPPNVWLGVSVTGILDWERRVNILMRVDAPLRFVSMEPLLGNVPDFRPRPDWLIVGRLTGRGTINNPPADHLRIIRKQCEADHLPLYEKSNLRGILYGPLIQEFPR